MHLVLLLFIWARYLAAPISSTKLEYDLFQEEEDSESSSDAGLGSDHESDAATATGKLLIS